MKKNQILTSFISNLHFLYAHNPVSLNVKFFKMNTSHILMLFFSVLLTIRNDISDYKTLGTLKSQLDRFPNFFLHVFCEGHNKNETNILLQMYALCIH